MPPKTSARAQDDKPDGPATKERPSASSAKMRRNASQTSNNQTRELPTVPTSAPAPSLSEPAPPTIPWASFERDALHAYRREHTLPSSTSFVSTFHQYILSEKAGVGLYSPTMARKRKARRQNKEQLALAVRKHFNGVGIQENDVIVDFISKIRHSKSVKVVGPSKNETLFAD
ncbi:hypothetical protein V2A60_003090 [Cordyceps javanica]|uniref:Sin3 binding region of histone deacetylase complex subunit SAP30 domain-containing protein n=1 Tax=Cordyceps javanica TaxID=43265 RepID=A0A545V477_9HYPO|nr:sin3 binding region of histone deacetylase complex subunit SAP30 domain-containing protein [Cordyceps javanica]TQW07800.1 sin3 binding region of histone deacetylase complex subunit SAP30 domain-containing protein [Cordyceps javanica]